MAIVYPNSIGDEAEVDFDALLTLYGDPGGALSIYLHALGSMLKQVDDISKDGPNGEPGWSQIFDLTRAKTEWLPWMGQLVGYQVPRQPDTQSLEEYDAIQRERIITHSSWLRGTVTSIRRAAQEHLGGLKRVNVFERRDDNPYHIHVSVYASEIITSEAEVRQAVFSDKMAGLLLDWAVLPGESWHDLLVGPYGGSWAAAESHYATWIDLYTG